jgi:hypothetical protein
MLFSFLRLPDLSIDTSQRPGSTPYPYAARVSIVEICGGPHAGDTIFLQAYDLVVAMYRDQGAVPMKLIDFEGTVNAATVAGHNGSGALRCLDTYDRPQYDWRSCSWSARRRKRVAGEER